MERLKALKEQLKKLHDETILTLSAKESLNDDERSQFKAALDQADTLKKDIELAERSANLKGWIEEPAKKGVSFYGQDGKASLGLDEEGEVKGIQFEGTGMTDKQFRALCEPSYGKAFRQYLKGKEDAADLKAMSEGLDRDGGYLVPPQMMREIIKRESDTAETVDLVRTLDGVTGDKVTWPKLDYSTDDIYRNAIRIQWSGESGGESQQEIKWGKIEIPIYTGMFQVELYRDFVEDAGIDTMAVVGEEARDSYRLGIDDVLVNADGVGKPHGLLFNPGGTNQPPTGNLGNPVTADNLISFVYGLPNQYLAGARGLLNSLTFATWATIKDTANNYVFGLTNNTDGGLMRARQLDLLGYGLALSPFMPVPGSANKVFIFGQFRKAYIRARRLAMTAEPYGLQDKAMLTANKIGIHFRFREGGAVVQPRALKVGVQS